ncbi:methionine adenosyltransferase domain-containing protein, partial [Staphylococcus aureus]|uniref:methionine adenosyltransferase domain-containing protein n=1 Tax=Staphylococcus aureus TaxID=1280 RepID=UPI001642A7E5
VPPALPHQCQVQLPYAIALAQPLSIPIDTFPTRKLSQPQLLQALTKHFHLTPPPIIKILHFKQPIYKQTPPYPHFPRTHVLFPWEKLDKV